MILSNAMHIQELLQVRLVVSYFDILYSTSVGKLEHFSVIKDTHIHIAPLKSRCEKGGTSIYYFKP